MTYVAAIHHTGSATLAVVDTRGARTAADLVAPDSVEDVFTPSERRYCGATGRLDRWLGRLAAKLAVVGLIEGIDLRTVEIIVDRSECRVPVCDRSHPPRAVVDGVAADDIAISISHRRRRAVAVAARIDANPL